MFKIYLLNIKIKKSLFKVEQLRTRGINAESLNSKISVKMKKSILADLNSEKPKIKLLYITPELG